MESRSSVRFGYAVGEPVPEAFAIRLATPPGSGDVQVRLLALPAARPQAPVAQLDRASAF